MASLRQDVSRPTEEIPSPAPLSPPKGDQMGWGQNIRSGTARAWGVPDASRLRLGRAPPAACCLALSKLPAWDQSTPGIQHETMEETEFRASTSAGPAQTTGAVWAHKDHPRVSGCAPPEATRVKSHLPIWLCSNHSALKETGRCPGSRKAPYLASVNVSSTFPQGPQLLLPLPGSQSTTNVSAGRFTVDQK